MFGAILGDIIGSPYEFDQGEKTKNFPLFSETSAFTDDTVMTIAVCDAFLSAYGKSDEEIKNALIDSIENISDLRKEFYKTMYRERYEKILKPAYEKLNK